MKNTGPDLINLRYLKPVCVYTTDSHIQLLNTACSLRPPCLRVCISLCLSRPPDKSLSQNTPPNWGVTWPLPFFTSDKVPVWGDSSPWSLEVSLPVWTGASRGQGLNLNHHGSQGLQAPCLTQTEHTTNSSTELNTCIPETSDPASQHSGGLSLQVVT